MDFEGYGVRLFPCKDFWGSEVIDFPNAYISGAGSTPEEALKDLREAFDFTVGFMLEKNLITKEQLRAVA